MVEAGTGGMYTRTGEGVGGFDGCAFYGDAELMSRADEVYPPRVFSVNAGGD